MLRVVVSANRAMIADKRWEVDIRFAQVTCDYDLPLHAVYKRVRIDFEAVKVI